MDALDRNLRLYAVCCMMLSRSCVCSVPSESKLHIREFLIAMCPERVIEKAENRADLQSMKMRPLTLLLQAVEAKLLPAVGAIVINPDDWKALYQGRCMVCYAIC